MGSKLLQYAVDNRGYCLTVLSRITKSEQDAEDIYQETLLALAKVKTFDSSKGTVKQYVAGALHNNAKRFYYEPPSPQVREPSTHCRNGHRRTEANTTISRDGYLRCRDCDRATLRRQRQKSNTSST